uniref:hypothetical protein n=1 Tax=Enterobacter asburiae TaxID=61645 RepID=UPI001954D368
IASRAIERGWDLSELPDRAAWAKLALGDFMGFGRTVAFVPKGGYLAAGLGADLLAGDYDWLDGNAREYLRTRQSVEIFLYFDEGQGRYVPR